MRQLDHRTIAGAILTSLVIVFAAPSCQQPSPPAAAQTTDPVAKGDAAPAIEPGRDAAAPTGPTPTTSTAEKKLSRRKPKLPVDSWIIFRTAADPDADVVCNYQWTGDNRLQVVTQNAVRLTLDLTKLPAGAPQHGPWNLQIDRQGIEITGVRGKVLDLIRSPNGIWSVDPKKPPRRS